MEYVQVLQGVVSQLSLLAMSFIPSTLKCQNCGYEMNVAVGKTGARTIASHPTECPKCKSKELIKISDGWHAKNDNAA